MKLIINKNNYVLQVKTKNKDKYYKFNKGGKCIDKYEVKVVDQLKPLKRLGEHYV